MLIKVSFRAVTSTSDFRSSTDFHSLDNFPDIVARPSADSLLTLVIFLLLEGRFAQENFSNLLAAHVGEKFGVVIPTCHTQFSNFGPQSAQNIARF